MKQMSLDEKWHFGMKGHIGVDADSGLLHTVIGTAANDNDVTQAACALLVHGEEPDVFADAGCQGFAKRERMRHIKANWHLSMRRANSKPWTRLRRWVR